MEYALKMESVCKEYPGFLLDHISLEVPKGCIVGLIGENGAGKSTTIRAALDLIKADSGTILFGDTRLHEKEKLKKEEIGVVFDEIHFYETLTPKKVGNISKKAYKNWNQITFDDYLTRFQLPVDKEIKTFSKGMKVKLSMAVALSHSPKLLILDEATSGLDPVMREDILDVFLEFVQDEEHSILMSSHITSDLEKIADYITFIHEGKIVFTEPKDTLIYEYGIIRCKEADLSRIQQENRVAMRKTEHQWEVLVRDKKRAEETYKDMIIDHATIDEIMLLFVKGEKVM